jgi:endonuclease/exonuclease/phosphatase family metal-dependent hydrolase
VRDFPRLGIFLLLAFAGIFPGLAAAQTVKAMTYNLRLDIASDSLNRWDLRKENVAALIRYYEPDFLGTQEGLFHQLVYLDSTLADYEYVGGGRNDGKQKGEFSALFYHAGRYRVLLDSTFWLSETPGLPSKGWDAALNRVCTYALLENKESGEKYWVFNTHFDHVGERARAESVRLILAGIRRVSAERDHPVILTGDLNLEPGEAPVSEVTAVLSDAYTASEIPPYGPVGTFNAFRFEKVPERRIDYVFFSPADFRARRYAAIDDFTDFRYPSDHMPVLVELVVE